MNIAMRPDVVLAAASQNDANTVGNHLEPAVCEEGSDPEATGTPS